jgi:hypothetical protein
LFITTSVCRTTLAIREPRKDLILDEVQERLGKSIESICSQLVPRCSKLSPQLEADLAVAPD